MLIETAHAYVQITLLLLVCSACPACLMPACIAYIYAYGFECASASVVTLLNLSFWPGRAVEAKESFWI